MKTSSKITTPDGSVIISKTGLLTLRRFFRARSSFASLLSFFQPMGWLSSYSLAAVKDSQRAAITLPLWPLLTLKTDAASRCLFAFFPPIIILCLVFPQKKSSFFFFSSSNCTLAVPPHDLLDPAEVRPHPGVDPGRWSAAKLAKRRNRRHVEPAAVLLVPDLQRAARIALAGVPATGFVPRAELAVDDAPREGPSIVGVGLLARFLGVLVEHHFEELVRVAADWGGEELEGDWF